MTKRLQVSEWRKLYIAPSAATRSAIKDEFARFAGKTRVA